jgi:hypothetical protein
MLRLPIFATLLSLGITAAAIAAPATPAPAQAAATPTLDERVAAMLPTEDEERFLRVGWRTNLMAARREAQAAGRPIFLWIMVGNPQGCT